MSVDNSNLSVTVAKFEAMKKRRDGILLERAKEEARLDAITHELDTLKEALKEYHVETEADARELLDRMTGEVAVALHTFDETMNVYETAKAESNELQ